MREVEGQEKSRWRYRIEPEDVGRRSPEVELEREKGEVSERWRKFV